LLGEAPLRWQWNIASFVYAPTQSSQAALYRKKLSWLVDYLQVTLARAMAALSLWQKIKLAWHLITSRDPIRYIYIMGRGNALRGFSFCTGSVVCRERQPMSPRMKAWKLYNVGLDMHSEL
jgi:hypothetical protein